MYPKQPLYRVYDYEVTEGCHLVLAIAITLLAAVGLDDGDDSYVYSLATRMDK